MNSPTARTDRAVARPNRAPRPAPAPHRGRAATSASPRCPTANRPDRIIESKSARIGRWAPTPAPRTDAQPLRLVGTATSSVCTRARQRDLAELAVRWNTLAVREDTPTLRLVVPTESVPVAPRASRR